MADTQYYLVVTDLGKTLIDEAYNSSTKVNIIEMALGDSGGSYVKPDSSFTQLVSEFGREDIHDDLGGNDGLIHVISKVTAKNAGQTVREFGLYDDLGNMIVYGAYPESLVPEVDSAEFIQLEIEAMVYLDNASAVTISVNPIYQYASELEAGIIKLIDELEVLEDDESNADDSKALTLFKMLKRKATDKLAGVTFLSHLTNGTSKEKAASEFAVGKKLNTEDSYRLNPKAATVKDADDLIEEGFWVLPGTAQSIANAPHNDATVIRVWPYSGFVLQIADSYYKEEVFHAFRMIPEGAKNRPWNKSYTSKNPPIFDDIKDKPDYYPSNDQSPLNNSWDTKTANFRTGSASSPDGSGLSGYVNWIQWGHNGGASYRHTIFSYADSSKHKELYYGAKNINEGKNVVKQFVFQYDTLKTELIRSPVDYTNSTILAKASYTVENGDCTILRPAGNSTENVNAGVDVYTKFTEIYKPKYKGNSQDTSSNSLTRVDYVNQLIRESFNVWDHVGKAAVGTSVSGHDVSDSFMEFYDYGEDDFDMVSFDPSKYETHIYYDGYYLVDVEVVRDDTKPSGANGINTFVMRNNIQIMHGFVDIADTDKRNPVRMRRVIKLYGGDKIKVYSDKDGEWIEGGSILFQYLRPIATSKSNKVATADIGLLQVEPDLNMPTVDVELPSKEKR